MAGFGEGSVVDGPDVNGSVAGVNGEWLNG